MTFATELIRIGREPVTIVEIDLDKCANTYGSAPCTASLSTGSECYNTRKTCQDPANFANTDTLTIKLSDRDIPGQTYFPCISRTKLSPVTITPGEPFGKRAKIEITINDFPHHDRGFDPYVSTRSYTPESQGTFWGKLIARNPYYQGRALRLKRGYIDATGSVVTQTENYVLENISGPDANGKVTIVAKDILKLADDERAVCPVASTGKLTAGITAGATSLTVTSGTEAEYIGHNILQSEDFNSRYWEYLTSIWSIIDGIATKIGGTGDGDISRPVYFHEGGQYVVTFTMSNRVSGSCTPKLKGGTVVTGTARSADGTYTETLTALAGNYLLTFTSSVTGNFDISDVSCRKINEFIRVGDEIIEAPYANRSANVFSNLTRGAWNTTASAHAIDDSVQACTHFDAENVRSIVNDLLVNFARISRDYIPTSDWDTESDTWFAGHNLTALITEPTGVKTLTDELSEQLLFYLWGDAVNQEIKFKAIAPPTSSGVTLNDDDNFVGAPSVTSKPEGRKSRVLIYYNPRNPIDITDAKDFDSIYGDIDAASESADQYGDQRLKKIFARWITSDSVALTTGSRLKNQFRDSPKLITFVMDAKDSDNVTGDTVNLLTRQIQGGDGAPESTLSQILSVEEITKDLPGTHFKYTAQQAFFGGRYAKIMASGASSVYSSATNTEKESGAYIASAGGADFSDGGEAYKIP